MEIISIIESIGTILAGGALFAIVDKIVYRKQEKITKTEQAKQTELETESKNIANDAAQIDLGKNAITLINDVFDTMQKMKDMMSTSFNMNEDNLKKIMNKVEVLEVHVGRIEGYLNGGLKEYVKAEEEKSVENN